MRKLILIFTGSSFFGFLLVLVFWVNNPEHIVSRGISKLGVNWSSPLSKDASPTFFEFAKFLDKSYYSSSGISTDLRRVDFKFSDSDKKFNDSSKSLFASSYSIDDELKTWRKTDAIVFGRKTKLKYKFHGGHGVPYKQGFASVKLKGIDDSGELLLTQCFSEANGVNQAFTVLNDFLQLYGPGIGEIVLSNLNGTPNSEHWLHEELDSTYMYAKYGLSHFKSFELNDEWDKHFKRISHTSVLDSFYYFLDIKSGSERDSKYNRIFKSFYDKLDLSALNKEYMGRFLALLYLYNDPHYIQGDNNQWILNLDDSLFYAFSRNEGTYEKVTDLDNFDEALFQKRESATTMIYKKSVCDSLILHYRNEHFYSLLKRKESILDSIDLVLSRAMGIHHKYSLSYSRTKFLVEKFQATIRHNLAQFESYLTRGEVIAAVEGDLNVIRFTSDLRVPFLLYWENDSVVMNTFELKLSERGDIKKKIGEIELPINGRNVDDIILLNYFTGDTIKNFTYNFF